MDKEIPKHEQRRELMKRLLRACAIPAGAALAGLVVWMMAKPSVDPADLTFATADRGNIDVTVSATGRVVPAVEQIITSPVASRVLEILSRPGDVVEVGTPLIRLDLEATRTGYDRDRDRLAMARLEADRLQAQSATRLNELEMKLKVKQMNLNRLSMQLSNERWLDSIGGGTADQVREAEYTLRSARLECEQLSTQLANERRSAKAELDIKRLDIEILARELALTERTLADADVRSPRRATVTSIINELGAQVAAGQQVAVLADLSSFRIDGEVADSYGRDVRPGSRATVKVARRELTGTVTMVSPTSKGGTYSFSVALDSAGCDVLRPGLKPDVYVANGTKENVVRIPNGSFYTSAGSYELFVDTGHGELERRSVRLGDASYDFIEVVSGIRPGERVVMSGMNGLADRERVTLKN